MPARVLTAIAVCSARGSAGARRGTPRWTNRRCSRPYVFFNDPDGRTGGRPWSVTQAFARVADKAGLPQVRLHEPSPLVSTRLLTNDVDARTVSGRLGHKNPNVTLSVYSHFFPKPTGRFETVGGGRRHGHRSWSAYRH